jgi:hypothetical protein
MMSNRGPGDIAALAPMTALSKPPTIGASDSPAPIGTGAMGCGTGSCCGLGAAAPPQPVIPAYLPESVKQALRASFKAQGIMPPMPGTVPGVPRPPTQKPGIAPGEEEIPGEAPTIIDTTQYQEVAPPDYDDEEYAAATGAPPWVLPILGIGAFAIVVGGIVWYVKSR